MIKTNVSLMTALSVLAFLFVPNAMLASEIKRIMPEPIPQPVPMPSPIRFVVGGNLDSIRINKYAVKTDVVGAFAQTELTITVHNPNKRNASADFLFPVPSGSVVNGFALDVNGKMVDGVIVEKQKGRQVFEAITRQGIDPGLVEKVEGNVFKARVFPISPDGQRTLKIHFVTQMNRVGNAYFYSVPLLANQTVKQFSVDISASNTTAKPLILNQSLKGAEFTQHMSEWGQVYKTQWSKANFSVDHALSIKIPAFGKSSQKVIDYAHGLSGELYFSLPMPNVVNNKTKRSQKALKNINLIWDASHSRMSANRDLESEFLDAFFQQHPRVTVSLRTLRHELSEPRIFEVKRGNWEDLNTFLKQMDYDGGTNLSALNAMDNTQPSLLFSDGVHTFDAKRLPQLNGVLHIISSSTAANTALSEQWAQQHRGQHLNLQDKSQIKSALARLAQNTVYLSEVNVRSGKVSLNTALPQALSTSQVPRLYGRLLSSEAELELVFKNAKGRVIKREKQTLKRPGKPKENGSIETLSAQQMLNHLSINLEDNREEIMELSRRYHLVTELTSLIVLESLNQYIEHNITPPESLPNMRAQYLEHKNRLQKTQQIEDERHQQQVLQQWKQRQNWWSQKQFPKYKEKPARAPVATMSLNAASDTVAEMEESVAAAPLRRELASNARASANKEAKSVGHAPNAAAVKIQAWNPDTPYLKQLRKAAPKARYATYYRLKKTYLNSPAFYFDCAHWFFSMEDEAFALQVLSNIAELKIKDSRLLRTMANTLIEKGYLNVGINTYRQVRTQRPEEPQSHRDLALALQMRAKQTRSKHDYQQALEHLYHVVKTPWPRFRGIAVTALTEMNQLLSESSTYRLDTDDIDKAYRLSMPVDMRITLGWDTDMTDIDLWVIEPNGEKVTYNHRLSSQGGMFHQDYTQGYGPEEYMLRNAQRGKYKVKVHFYGNRSPEISGSTTLYVKAFTNYGRKNQAAKTISLRLKKANDDYYVGSFEW